MAAFDIQPRMNVGSLAIPDLIVMLSLILVMLSLREVAADVKEERRCSLSTEYQVAHSALYTTVSLRDHMSDGRGISRSEIRVQQVKMLYGVNL